MISAIIITKNEENNIRDCLNSISWVDEIVVVDSGSSDATVSICKEFGCIVQETDWPGFGPQKNRALALATKPWVLSIDADERVTPELRDEIQALIQSEPQQNGFEPPRSSNFCGRFMKHSGWYPDHVLRLFRRESARFTDDIVHERVICEGAIRKLSNPLLHYTYDTLFQAVEKANLYSDLGAEKLFKEGKRSGLTKAVLKGFWAFFRTYLLRAGFLDGKQGLMLAITNAEATYYKYAKLMLLSDQRDNS